MIKNYAFPERLRMLRKERNLKQGELGDVLDLSRASISYYELGLRTPDIISLGELAIFFNVSADYLIGITDERKIKEPVHNCELCDARMEKVYYCKDCTAKVLRF